MQMIGWMKIFLQVMVNQIKKDPKIGMIFCNYYLVDKKGSIIDQFVRHDFKKVKLLDQPCFIRKYAV